jgi:hypothetical protein
LLYPSLVHGPRTHEGVGPLAFRRRFIFTEAEPLRRASMPRDGRWWAYETIRSDLAPTPEEQRERVGRISGA